MEAQRIGARHPGHDQTISADLCQNGHARMDVQAADLTCQLLSIGKRRSVVGHANQVDQVLKEAYHASVM